MNKISATLALAGSLFFGAGSALAADLDFTLVNKTGYGISEVYVSPGSSDDWEEDVMGSDVLANGERVDISFPKGTKGCKWDMMVTYDDGEEAIWHDFDLCSISKLTLRYDRKKGKTWAEME